jgi:hypothetical protein
VSAHEALAILDEAASIAPLTRLHHIRVQQAVAALREALGVQPPPTPSGGG